MLFRRRKFFWHKKRGNQTYLPQRYILSILAFLGVVNMYAMRTNLSIAMVAMAKVPVNKNSKQLQTCPELIEKFNATNDSAPFQDKGEFDWDSKVQGYLLGAFFYGYITSPIPAGVISTTYGAKWLFGLGIFLAGIFTLLSPLAARWHYWAFFISRIMVGLGSGMAFPAIHTLIGKWMPENERSRQNTLIYNGIAVGTIFTLMLSGIIIKSGFLGGWPSAFYITGVITCLWFILWAVFVYESPHVHPFITKEELHLIMGGVKPQPKRGPIPWKAISTSLPLYALAATHFGNNWGFYTLLTFLPTYLAQVLHFDIKKGGFFSSMPYMSLFVFATVASVIIDKLRSLEKMKITTLRKISNSIAMFLPGLCLLIIPFLECEPIPIVVLLILCSGFNGFKLSGFHVTHIDMSPEFGGLLMAGTNSIANLAGVFSPMFAGHITSSGHTLNNWKIVFVTAATVYFLAGIIYDVFCTAKEQPWGRTKQPSEDMEENADFERNTEDDETEGSKHVQNSEDVDSKKK